MEMGLYITFFLIVLLLWIMPAAALAKPQMMGREVGESILLEDVVIITGNTEASKKLADTLRRLGIKVGMLTPPNAMASNGLQWKQEIISHTVIVLGGIHSNPAMLPLYAGYLSFGDADYPGDDGYVIRTIARPFGAGTSSIALEASTPEGEAKAVERFIAILSESGSRHFPQTLEAHLTDYWSNNIRRSQSGIRYALTGDPRWAEEGIRLLLDSMNPETGWFDYGDYGIERYVRDYGLLQDAPGISQDDWLRLDQGLLKTVILSAGEWWRSKDGRRIGGRHQTMGTSCFAAAVHLLLRRGNPNEEAKALLHKWWAESQDYWKGVCSTFHDDLDGIPCYYSPEPALDWALIMGFDDYPKHQLPLAVLRAYAVIDNMGYYAGTGTYEECRPGDLFKTVPWGWLLKATNYFHPGEGHDWLWQNMPNTDIGTWGVSRSIAGARAFSVASEPIVPVHLLGITTVPMGPYRYAQLPHSSVEGPSGGRQYLPASLERCFEKMCFRDSFDRDGQYLVLEGYQTSWADNLVPMDANSIIRYTDLGHIWLHSNSEKSGNLFRSGVFCTDGINDSLQPAGCELQALFSGSDIGLVASHFPDYVACDWTRNMIWRRGKYFVVIDLMRQNKEGKFGLICSFRTPQKAWLQQDGMLVREGTAEMHILNADQVQLSLEDEHELEGAAIPTFLRETQFLDGNVGTIKTFRNLLYAADPDHPGDLEVRPVGEMGMMVKGSIRGEEEFALLTASPHGDSIKIGPFETDAQVLYVGLSGWFQTGGTGLKFNGKSYDGSEGKTDLQISIALENLWATANTVIRPDINVGLESHLKKVWQFEDFSYLPASAIAPILTSEPEPQGVLGSLLDGVVTRGATVRWPSGVSEVKLSLDLREGQRIQQIDFQTGQFGSYNTIPDPAAYPEPRVVPAEFSNDNFQQDVRSKELVFTSDCTFEGIHKGSVFPIMRWTSQNVSEDAHYVRLIFSQQNWSDRLGMNELSVRYQGQNSARIVGHVLRDVNGDGEKDILAWSDQAELVAVGPDGKLLWKRQFPGYITAVECYSDLHQEAPRILVTTREARLYCLAQNGQEIWKTDFLESAKLNGDLPVAYSIGLLKKPDGVPLIMVGNYNLATFLDPQGNVLKYERLPAAYQTMTLSRGFDYDGDGLEDIVSTEVWGALSVLDTEMRRRAGARSPRGRGIMLEYWKPPTQEEAKVIICSENGMGLFDLKRLSFDWLQNVKPINDCVIADIDGDGKQEIILVKQDGYLLVYNGDGKLIKSTVVGEQIRSVAVVTSDDGGQAVIAALYKRLVRFTSDLTDWATIAFGEYRRLAILNDKRLLLAFRDGAVIDAFK